MQNLFDHSKTEIIITGRNIQDLIFFHGSKLGYNRSDFIDMYQVVGKGIFVFSQHMVKQTVVTLFPRVLINLILLTKYLQRKLIKLISLQSARILTHCFEQLSTSFYLVLPVSPKHLQWI